MNSKLHDLEVLLDLQRGGVPFDKQVLEDLKTASRGFSIYQTGTSVDSSVFDLDFGGSGYMLNVVMCNDSSRIISAREFQLDIPWDGPNFRWLDDPFRKSPRQYEYSFPRHGPEGFDREAVLNHRLGKHGRLNPREQLEGLLLGVGQAPIPKKYSDRQCLVTRLYVLDDLGNRYQGIIKLGVSREGHVGSGPAQKMQRDKKRQAGRVSTRESYQLARR
jgi:hypothetical protein